MSIERRLITYKVGLPERERPKKIGSTREVVVFKRPSFLTMRRFRLPRTETLLPPVEPLAEKQMTLEDVIEGMKTRKIRWGEVPPQLLNEILTKTAAEISERDKISLPVGLLEYSDLRKNKLAFLGGKKLLGLYEHERTADIHNKTDVMARLFEKAEITVTLEDIQKAGDLKRRIYWERVNAETLHEIFTQVSIQLRKPIELLVASDLQNNHFTFIGRDLGSLIMYALRNNTEENKDVMTWLREKANKKRTGKDIINKIGSNKNILWKKIDNETFQDFLETMEQQIGKPIFLWTAPDFSIEYEILNGKSLSNLLQHINRNKKNKDMIIYLYELSGKKIIAQKLFSVMKTHADSWAKLTQKRKNELFKMANVITNVPDVITALENGESLWERVHPDTQRELINRASEELGILPPMLSKELLSQPFAFLAGHRLDGMYAYREGEERKEKPQVHPDIILSMLKYAEVNVVIPEKEHPQKSTIDAESIKGVDPLSVRLRHPVLTQEQEQKLFRYIKYNIPIEWLRQDKDFLDSFGDYEDKSRQQIERIVLQSKTPKGVLMFCNARLVETIIQRYGENNLSVKDKRDAGDDGLSRAINNFDPERGFKLDSYANWYISQALQKEIATKGYAFPIPMKFFSNYGILLHIADTFQKIFHKKPTREELRQQAIVHTDRKRYPISSIESILDFLYLVKKDPLLSLNEKMYDDDSVERGDNLRSAKESVEDAVVKKNILERSIAQLTPEEQIVVRFFSEGYTLDEIADNSGRSLKEITTIFTCAVAKLQSDEGLQELREERNLTVDNTTIVGVTQQSDSDSGDDIEQRVRAAGLHSTTIENYLAIIDLREQGLSSKEIAQRIELPYWKVTKVILRELIQKGLVEKQNQGITPYLLSLGLLSQEELERRASLPTDRAAYISEETRLVGQYLEEHPLPSFQKMFKRFYPYRTA